jgi:hypothetical protein
VRGRRMEAMLTRAHGGDGAMTLRRHSRELYRVFSEEEFLRLGDWQSGAARAGHVEVATRLSGGGGDRSDRAAINSAGRPMGLLIGATVVTGLLGGIAWLLAGSSSTRISAARRWQGRGAPTASSASDPARAAVAVRHAPRLVGPAAPPSPRPAAGRRNAGKGGRVGEPAVTGAPAGGAGVRPGSVQSMRLTPRSRATQAPEVPSSQLATRAASPSGTGAESRLRPAADFTFER